jgi:hypothetical protein
MRNCPRSVEAPRASVSRFRNFGKTSKRQIRLAFVLAIVVVSSSDAEQSSSLCLDEFCIGQGIEEAAFDRTSWIILRNGFIREPCGGCQPNEAFRSYDEQEKLKLAEALSWIFHDNSNSMPYNVITLPLSLRLCRSE